MDENDTTTSSTYHNMMIALEELGILDCAIAELLSRRPATERSCDEWIHAAFELPELYADKGVEAAPSSSTREVG